ncbi:hypothetical protein [Mycobacterium paragordonae]|uniref:hypothetical protein n=1 Tax=Mycobacterium paragordonae TaxID=1389713 RepID=UPI0012E1FFB0|nr:hypothetical protein [Mycobacterium paragordonae]
MPASDADPVAALEKQIEMVRAALAEFNADCQRRADDLGPFGEEVQVTIERDGYIEDLYIDPTALTRYTHIELEDLITDVLRGGSERMLTVLNEAFDQHIGPSDSPVRELLQ